MKGRFAPSPTGYIHLGNVWIALLSYVSTRQQKGQYVVRMEDKVEFRKQVIACKPEDIVALADVVEPVLKDNHICTMGNEQKIKDAGKVFDNIISLG